jgi:competence protein ComEC
MGRLFRRLLLIQLAHWLAFSVAYAQEERVVPSDRVTTFVYVRSAPDGDAEERGRLQVGESADLIQSVPRWYEVRLPSGVTGFVSKSWTTVTHAVTDRAEDQLRIHHLSIGTGSCAIVECPGTNAPPMIVDCGSIGQTGDDLTVDGAAAYIQNVLARHSVGPNVVLSHADRDHYSHIPTVLADIQAENIWLGGQTADYSSDDFLEWLEEQRDGGANILDETKLPPNFSNNGEPIGPTLGCGAANAYVLTVNTGADKNTNSLVLMLEYHEFTAVFSGDAEGLTEQQAIDNFDGNVKATVMTGSHHGARTKGSNSPAWAEATAPDVMVYSAGEKFSHPTCTAVERFTTVTETTEHRARCGQTGGYRSYRTRRAEYMTKSVGAIIITSNGHSPLSVHCAKSAECGVQIAH